MRTVTFREGNRKSLVIITRWITRKIIWCNLSRRFQSKSIGVLCQHDCSCKRQCEIATSHPGKREHFLPSAFFCSESIHRCTYIYNIHMYACIHNIYHYKFVSFFLFVHQRCAVCWDIFGWFHDTTDLPRCLRGHEWDAFLCAQSLPSRRG